MGIYEAGGGTRVVHSVERPALLYSALGFSAAVDSPIPRFANTGVLFHDKFVDNVRTVGS